MRHLREIIRSLDVQDAIQGVEFASLSYASKVIPPEKDEEERLEWKERDCDKGGMPPPEHLLPGKKDVSLKHLVYEGDDEPKQKYVALRSLEFSPFNPPQGNRKMKVRLPLASSLTLVGSTTYLLLSCPCLGRHSLPGGGHRGGPPLPHQLLHARILREPV